ncbi:MAG: hypothetical protein EOO73_28235 [Myxococcales bacterium]|nr:MAG: hypothetical protein EOO73_28235 [Myxococcales bacterium]
MSSTRAHRFAFTDCCVFLSASLFFAGACSSDSESPPTSPNAGASGALPSGGGGGSGVPAGGAAGASGSDSTSASGANNVKGGAAGTGGMSGASSAGAAAVGDNGGASSGGASGAAGASGVESPPGFFTDGFLKRDPWQGYVFTIADALGSTVSPVCDTAGCTPAWGAQPCAKGTVAKNAMSASFAGLAFHAIDPMGGPRGVWLAAGTGIYVSVTTPPASARLQLQQKMASNDTRYCAPLPAGGTGLIPFADFKTYCWGDVAHPSKPFTAGTDVHEVTVVVPGSSTADQPFDFCLADIQPR